MEEKQISIKLNSDSSRLKTKRSPFSVPPLIRMNAKVDLFCKDVSKKHKTKSIMRIMS